MPPVPAPTIDWSKFPWARFLREHYRRRPAVFSGVLDQPLASGREAFAITRAGAVPSRSGRSPRLRHQEGTRPVAAEGPREPRASDRSVAGYLARLERDGGSYGYIVNDAQAASAPLFARMGGFLDALYTQIGMPTGGALLDLFAGHYRRPLLHPHKDEQDVFTFVVAGRKRFLAWPFDLLARRFAVPEQHRFTPYTLPAARLNALRSEAMVLEAGPGDVIYWPADWWHAADPTGSLVVTLGLGIYRRANRLGFVSPDNAVYTAD